MKYETILVGSGRVATITLNRPEKRNALSAAMLEELREALLALDRSAETVVIVLRGAGRGFCAGADLGNVMGERSVMESRDVKRGVMELLLTMGALEKVLLAQVHGFALAGGFGLAAACDLVVAAEDCKFAMPEIKRGLGPMNIMSPLSRSMPRRKLLELMLTGETFTALEALEWGVVNRVVPEGDLNAAAMELAGLVASHSGAAVRLCKSAFTHMQHMDSATAYHYLTEMLTICGSTEDAAEGVKAFLEKREPVWRDR